MAIMAVVVLSGCSLSTKLPLTSSGSIRDIIHTATGFVLKVTKQTAAAIELGKMGVQKAQDTVTEVQKRAGQVQQGVGTVTRGIQDLKNGKDMIEKAVTK